MHTYRHCADDGTIGMGANEISINELFPALLNLALQYYCVEAQGLNSETYFKAMKQVIKIVCN